MSVKVTIDIANGAAHRTLQIHNVDCHEGERDPDTIGNYIVERTNSPDGGGHQTATFQHRYGDDVTILVAKAGEALRTKHGHV